MFVSRCGSECYLQHLPESEWDKVSVKQHEISYEETSQMLFCPLDRYTTDELAIIIGNNVPYISPQQIVGFLNENVNEPNYDKIAPNMPDGFNSQNSISGYEAFFFARRMLFENMEEGFETDVNRTLAGIYLGGDVSLRNIPSFHYVFFKQCHDGDTCTILEIQNSACRFNQVQTAVRISNIDAPEVGYYSTNSSSWINSKLIENVEKIYGEWLKDEDLPPCIVRNIKKLLALRINYTGQLSGLIRNDLNIWNFSQNVPRLIQESSVNWYWDGKGEKTPIALCGTWQPFDAFGRRLGLFYQILPSFLESYIKIRLSELMSSNGMEKYLIYLQKINPIIRELNDYENDKVQNFLHLFESGEENPSKIFSQANCAAMAQEFKTFALSHDPIFLKDDQVMQIIIGSVYAYDKYRSQNGDIYNEAGNLARQKGFGFWRESTFRTLYEINEKDARYHPPHCP